MQPPILIVEDDLKIARIIKAYLEGADFRAVHADSAKDALKKAELELPLAVILVKCLFNKFLFPVSE